MHRRSECALQTWEVLDHDPEVEDGLDGLTQTPCHHHLVVNQLERPGLEGLRVDHR